MVNPCSNHGFNHETSQQNQAKRPRGFRTRSWSISGTGQWTRRYPEAPEIQSTGEYSAMVSIQLTDLTDGAWKWQGFCVVTNLSSPADHCRVYLNLLEGKWFYMETVQKLRLTRPHFCFFVLIIHFWWYPILTHTHTHMLHVWCI